MESFPNSSASTEDFEFSALKEAIHYPKAIVREFSPYLRGDIVEVGAGIGQMARHFARETKIESFTAVEPDARFANEFRNACPDLTLVEGMARSLTLPDGCDAIVSVNVLEHIEDDVDELKQYMKLLKPRRGHVCILAPARPEIFSKIDQDFGHFRRYTRSSISKALVSAGFQPIKIHYFNFAGYFAWWLNFKLLEQRSFNPVMVRLYDQVIFRYCHIIEKGIHRPPLGQSVIAVAKA